MKTFNATVFTSFGFGLEKIKATNLESAFNKSLDRFGNKLSDVMCVDTGETIWNDQRL